MEQSTLLTRLAESRDLTRLMDELLRGEGNVSAGAIAGMRVMLRSVNEVLDSAYAAINQPVSISAASFESMIVEQASMAAGELSSVPALSPTSSSLAAAIEVSVVPSETATVQVPAMREEKPTVSPIVREERTVSTIITPSPDMQGNSILERLAKMRTAAVQQDNEQTAAAVTAVATEIEAQEVSKADAAPATMPSAARRSELRSSLERLIELTEASR